MGQHRSASASRLLGLDGFEVLAAEVVGGEWRLAVQTTAELDGCAGCGVRAEAHRRRTVRVRDLPAGGRPVVLAWRKRIWRCTEPACGVRTWTEQVAAIRPRAVLTERARAEACRRVGLDETSFLTATRLAPTRYVTGLVDLECGRLRSGTPPWSLTTSTPSGWPTPWSTRSAAACSRRPWATGAASAIRCTASASCY